MRRKEPFIARMMLLSELKADNDSVIMAHCEYLSWKDLGKMNRHCWFVKTEQLVFGLQKHSELSTTFLFKNFPKTRYFSEGWMRRDHFKKFQLFPCLIFSPEIDSMYCFFFIREVKKFYVSCIYFNLVDKSNTFKECSQNSNAKY